MAHDRKYEGLERNPNQESAKEKSMDRHNENARATAAVESDSPRIHTEHL